MSKVASQVLQMGFALLAKPNRVKKTPFLLSLLALTDTRHAWHHHQLERARIV